MGTCSLVRRARARTGISDATGTNGQDQLWCAPARVSRSPVPPYCSMLIGRGIGPALVLRVSARAVASFIGAGTRISQCISRGVTKLGSRA